MNERPTEPYDPADPGTAADRPAAADSPAAADVPQTPGPAGQPIISPVVPPASTTPAATPPPVYVPPDMAAQPGTSGEAGPPVDGAAPAELEPFAVYSPEPDRVDRDRATWQTPVQPTPESWFEPTAAAATATAAPAAATATGSSAGRRRGDGILVPVFAAALISAILASGGMYLTLRASGALDQPAATVANPIGQTTGVTQPIKIDESSAIIAVAAKVGPAVVRIVSSASANANDPTATEGIGSGVIYDKNGWILTNRHVVSGSDTLQVELKDGRRFEGKTYGIDTLTDLAIVKIQATDLPTAALGDSSALKVGQTTIAIGSPLGTYSNTVTSGILSATGRTIETDTGSINNLLQTDTAINPGNSGGPLLDAGGNVIGINTAIAANANGIGFAIPINIAKPIMEQAVAGQKLARPYVGIRYEMLDVQRAGELNLSVTDGAYVDGAQSGTGQATDAVVPDGPADKAGIKQGDIIVSIEGQAIDTEHPLDAVLTQFAPGRTVTVGLLRSGQKVEVQVTLGTRPPNL
jgi:S1-C subfamily serine protease